MLCGILRKVSNYQKPIETLGSLSSAVLKHNKYYCILTQASVSIHLKQCKQRSTFQDQDFLTPQNKLFPLISNYHNTSYVCGRYGHRLIKLWEQPEYTTEPLKVYRTGGRLPVENWKGEIVPGRVWTAKLGGGLDRKFHWIERTRLTADEVEAKVMYQEKIIKIFEDDNRSGHVALVAGPFKRRYILCTQNMKVGDLVTNSARTAIGGLIFKDGDAYPLYLVPNGTKVCFVEFRPGKGGQIARSAGAFCTITKKLDKRVILQMPSKREINVDERCVAVIGAVSNPEHDDEVWGSAFRRREYGLRPRTGRHHKKGGRFSARSIGALPPVVIPDRQVLQRNTDFED